MIVNENNTYSGYCVDLIDALAISLNFTYEIQIPEDRRYGSIENGAWNGLMKELLEEVCQLKFYLENLPKSLNFIFNHVLHIREEI